MMKLRCGDDKQIQCFAKFLLKNWHQFSFLIHVTLGLFSPPPPPNRVRSLPYWCQHLGRRFLLPAPIWYPKKIVFGSQQFLSLQKIMYCVMENDCKTNFWYHSHTKHSVKTLIYCCIVLTGVYVLRCISNVFLTLMTKITTQCHKTGWNHVLNVRSHHQTFHKSLRTWVCPKF